MCGIAGIFDRIGHRGISPEKLAVLSNEIHHRGRDDVGYYTDQGCGLIHRRLSIIDPHHGHQPMSDKLQQVFITFNGMIYNYQALRKKLILAGHKFKTNSDTEVLLNSYLAWGTDCVDYLDGFFAFSIYDKRKDIIFCARDILGQKPFYYYLGDHSYFYFASEVGALLEMLTQRPEISVSSLQDYLTFGFNTGTKTLFNQLYQLKAGHSMVIKRNVDKISFYDFSSKIVHKDYNKITNYTEALAHTETLLKQAVEKRLVADVPIGSLLSGGLDSGLITAMVAQKTDKITAFTAGFTDKNIDEACAAEALAKNLGIQHQVLTISQPPESIIDDIAMIANEPFADAAIIPLYMICNKAKEHAKVLLSGDGSDELFAGYARYNSFIKQEIFKSLLSLKTRKLLFQKLADYYPQHLNMPKFLRAGATFEAISDTPQGGYLRNIAIARMHDVNNILSDYSKENQSKYDSAELLSSFFPDSSAPQYDAFNHARYADMKFWLPGRMLTKSDRASMAASIEMRSPFLDLDLTAYGLQLPHHFLKHPLGGKKIIRDIAKKYLPVAHLKRPKQGFVMPLAELLRGDWRNRLEAVINDKAFSETNLFNMAVLKKMMYAHISKHQDHSRILWAIIQLEAFLRMHKFI